MRWLAAALMLCGGSIPPLAAGETSDPPQPIMLPVDDLGAGWKFWRGIGDLEGSINYRERGTAIAVTDSQVWVGTSQGRLLSRTGDGWTLQVTLPDVQVTGIAFHEDRKGNDVVWLATSDGLRLLNAGETGWVVHAFRHYYEGHPAFVSGGYIPGEDAVRLWGYVDDVIVPRKVKSYAPFVISTEHGLFSWASYHGVWHHFLPHYWGANSDWLDARELLPGRRPTCMVEDSGANLWIGSDGDGLLRMNAHARRYSKRSPDDNAKDGTEWTRFGSADIGKEFDVVHALAAGGESGVWATLSDRESRQRCVAHYDGQGWTTFELPRITRRTQRGGKVVKEEWREALPVSVAEPQPGIVLVGVESNWLRQGMYRLDPQKAEFTPIDEVKYPVKQIELDDGGNLWGLTAWGLYQRSFLDE